MSFQSLAATVADAHALMNQYAQRFARGETRASLFDPYQAEFARHIEDFRAKVKSCRRLAAQNPFAFERLWTALDEAGVVVDAMREWSPARGADGDLHDKYLCALLAVNRRAHGIIAELHNIAESFDEKSNPAKGNEESGGNSKKKRGRPADTDPRADQRIADAWGTRQFRTYAELADEFRISKHDAASAIERVRNRNRRSRAAGQNPSRPSN